MKTNSEKIIGVLLIGLLVFSPIINVFAKTLTITEVHEEFKKLIIDEINEIGGDMSSSLDTTNKTLDVFSGDEKIVSFKYTDEYIELDNREGDLTPEIAENSIDYFFPLVGIVQAIINLSGYEDKTIEIDDEDDLTNTYDTYGLQFETEPFEYSSDDPDNEWELSGDYIRYFKMSFDTDKIDALIEEYGVDAEETDLSDEIIAMLKPTLRVGEVTEDSITLYPNISIDNSNADGVIYCDIYRSDSENGTYTKISEEGVICTKDEAFIDEELQSNTTYYYKAVIQEGDIFSDIVKATTKAPVQAEATSNKNNPQTGVFFPTMSILILLIGSISIAFYTRKKSIYK